MVVNANTPQVHLIGEIKGATGFDTSRIFCKFEVRAGTNWTLLGGKDSGETYEEIRDEIDEYAVWDHPFDLHFKCKAMRGWPKFYVEVWQADTQGRYSIAGYGVGVVPFEPGQHKMEIKCWAPKPTGYFKQLASDLLGIKPELKFKDMLMSGAERFGFEADTTGTVEIDVGVIIKDFNLHGVTLFAAK